MRFQLLTAIPNSLDPDAALVTELEVREDVTLGDMLAASRRSKTDEHMHDIVLVARLTNLEPAIIELMDIGDWEALQTLVSDLKKARSAARAAKFPPPKTASASSRKAGRPASSNG